MIVTLSSHAVFLHQFKGSREGPYNSWKKTTINLSDLGPDNGVFLDTNSKSTNNKRRNTYTEINENDLCSKDTTEKGKEVLRRDRNT